MQSTKAACCRYVQHECKNFFLMKLRDLVTQWPYHRGYYEEQIKNNNIASHVFDMTLLYVFGETSSCSCWISFTPSSMQSLWCEWCCSIHECHAKKSFMHTLMGSDSSNVLMLECKSDSVILQGISRQLKFRWSNAWKSGTEERIEHAKRRYWKWYPAPCIYTTSGKKSFLPCTGFQIPKDILAIYWREIYLSSCQLNCSRHCLCSQWDSKIPSPASSC